MGINSFGEVPLSNNLRVFWQDGMPKDTIVFNFIIDDENSYNLTGIFCKGPMHGRFACILNSNLLLPEFSLLSETPSMVKIRLGQAKLEKGENQISFVVLPDNRRRNLFAMDLLEAK